MAQIQYNPAENVDERCLPPYLQHDLENYKRTSEAGLLEATDWWCELYGSINSAEVDREISSEVAWYLREKYLGLEKY